MNRKGLLIVISGFSGAGKGTAMKRLLEKYDNYALSISATTRAPRAGEENGREYFFKTVEEFEEMISKNQLIEYAKYVNNYYGTPRQYVEEQMSLGRNVILEIEIQGAINIRKQYPDAVLMFITPPSAIELKNRLVGRGTEDIDTINKRMLRAVEEAQELETHRDVYNYVVVNDDLEKCVDDIHGIIETEHKKLDKNLDLINNVKKGIQDLSEGE